MEEMEVKYIPSCLFSILCGGGVGHGTHLV